MSTPRALVRTRFGRLMPRDINFGKEAFSRAYVAAVAAATGFAVQKREVDIDSVDGSIYSRASNGAIRSPSLDFQLKCTSVAQVDATTVRQRISRKNYDELSATNLMVPRILIVVVVPADVSDWLEQDDSRTLLRRCGYWMSLYGAPAISRQSKVVRMPKVQCFTVAALEAMIERVGQKQLV